MNERDELRLLHMRDAARNALKFAEGHTEQDIGTDLYFTYAVSYALQIIGEAAAKITKETRTLHPQIAWDQIIGMRQWIVHGYDAVKLEVIWSTITNDLAPLIEKLDTILRTTPPEEPGDI